MPCHKFWQLHVQQLQEIPLGYVAGREIVGAGGVDSSFTEAFAQTAHPLDELAGILVIPLTAKTYNPLDAAGICLPGIVGIRASRSPARAAKPSRMGLSL